jgi:hypothetical protein
MSEQEGEEKQQSEEERLKARIAELEFQLEFEIRQKDTVIGLLRERIKQLKSKLQQQ